MCDPISAGIASAIGTGVSLIGSMQQASAQKDAAQAVADQNRAEQVAQAQAFTQRNQAAQQQTAAQFAASQETLNARGAAADQMRQAQTAAMQRYQDTIGAENTQAEALRQTGDTAAQQLLQQTNTDALAAAQQARQQQTQAISNQAAQPPPGPTTSDPAGSTNAVTNDLATGGAAARRTAEAATNIRNYGSRIAAVDAYGAPLQKVGLATADTAYGLMPTVTAANLLRSGSDVRLLPSKVAYGGATSLGQAQDTLLQSRGQNALDAAGLSYGNAVDIANLQQSNADTIAGNISKQRQADDAAKAAQAGILTGVGKLVDYGAGYFGGFSGTPGFAAGSGEGAGLYTNLATGEVVGASQVPGTFAHTISSVGNKLSNIF
jgi:hypothetical protein